jgi:hypothetical protein
MNGQGFALLSASYASATAFPGIAFAGRLSMVGNLDKSLAVSTAGGGAYNLGPLIPQRWGDYSQTVVDPNDDMTMWSFQEYASATDVWTVRATKYMAPPPARPLSVTPRVVGKSASTVITINGLADPGLFFDPGPGFPHRLGVSFSGGVTVNAITAIGATQLQVDINTLAAATGSINGTVTNPDGQTSTGAALFAVSAVGGDFDADMRADMTLYKSKGEWDILTSTSGYTTSTAMNVGGPGYVPVAGDYDGDGRQDPAAYNTTTGQWLALESSTNYTTTFSQTWGGPGYIPEPGDYDGDGKADLAVYVESTANWLILKSSSGFTTTINVFWGGVGYTPVPGQDFDGDGKADIAVYSESAGTWYVLKSSTNYTTSLIVAWGGRGYTLVPGDYDGDNKTDLGLYQRATGNWYVLKSSAGYTTTLNVPWGGLAYDPVPGDYDGDGKFDLAVVQRETGNWSSSSRTRGSPRASTSRAGARRSTRGSPARSASAATTCGAPRMSMVTARPTSPSTTRAWRRGTRCCRGRPSPRRPTTSRAEPASRWRRGISTATVNSITVCIRPAPAIGPCRCRARASRRRSPGRWAAGPTRRWSATTTATARATSPSTTARPPIGSC